MTIEEIFLSLRFSALSIIPPNAAYLFISQRRYIILTIVQDNLYIY